MPYRLATLIVGLLLATTSPVYTQSPRPIPAAPLSFESWRAGAPLDRPSQPVTGQFLVTSRDRTRHALLGGAIGAAAGVAFCTVVSTLVDDSADGGLSFCPLDSNLLIGAAGFALGAVIGWAI